MSEIIKEELIQLTIERPEEEITHTLSCSLSTFDFTAYLTKKIDKLEFLHKIDDILAIFNLKSDGVIKFVHNGKEYVYYFY